MSIYKVELPESADALQTPFHESIQIASEQPLAERNKSVNSKNYRLEHHRCSDGCHYLNFVTLEFDGPGRAQPEKPAISIGLAPEESFAHQTALMYDPQTELAFLETSRGSMGPGAIARYFEAFSDRDTNYSLLPSLDRDAAARARRHQTIRSVVMRVSVGQITESDRAAGLGVIKSFGDEFDASVVDIELKVGRERVRSLSRERIWSAIGSILGDSGESSVTRLILRGREHDDEKLEMIDLIQHREKRECSLRVDDESRQLPYVDRWDALRAISEEYLS